MLSRIVCLHFLCVVSFFVMSYDFRAYGQEINLNQLLIMKKQDNMVGSNELRTFIKDNPDIVRTVIEDAANSDLDTFQQAIRIGISSYSHLSREDKEFLTDIVLKSDLSIKKFGLSLLAKNSEINRIYLNSAGENEILNLLKMFLSTQSAPIDWYTLSILSAKTQIADANKIFDKIIQNTDKSSLIDEQGFTDWERLHKFRAAHLGKAILGNSKSIDFLIDEFMLEEIMDWQVIFAQIRNKKIPLYLLSLLDDSKPETAPPGSEFGDIVIEPYNLPIRRALMVYFPEMLKDMKTYRSAEVTNEQVRQWVSTVGIPNLEKEIKESKRKR